MRRVLQALFFVGPVRLFVALFLGLRVRGREHLPREGPAVVVANHASHLDTLALLSLFPLSTLHRVRPVAAGDYFLRNHVVEQLARTFFHILPIRRQAGGEGEEPLAAMAQALDRGEILLLFPQGTRGEPGSFAPFKPGVGMLLERRPGTPVVPVGLRNFGRSLPKGALLPVPFFGEVDIGEPRRPPGGPREVAAALEQAVRELRGPHPNR